jgi:hypothetical protein
MRWYQIETAANGTAQVTYQVYATVNGSIKTWQVTEHYKYAQGFREYLPNVDNVTELLVDQGCVLGFEYQGLKNTSFSFENMTDREQLDVERNWYNRGLAWVEASDVWCLEDRAIAIAQPFTVAIVDQDLYTFEPQAA